MNTSNPAPAAANPEAGMPWWFTYCAARARGASKANAARAAGSSAVNRGTLHRWSKRAETHEVVRAVIEGARKRSAAAAEAYLAIVRQHVLSKQPIPR